jgi:hypothetical protein
MAILDSRRSPSVIIDAHEKRLLAELAAEGHEALLLLTVAVVRAADGQLHAPLAVPSMEAVDGIPGERRERVAAHLRSLAEMVDGGRPPRAYVVGGRPAMARELGNRLLAAGVVEVPADVRYLPSPAHVEAVRFVEGDRVFHLPGERIQALEQTLRAIERVERESGVRVEHVVLEWWS